MLRDFMLDTLGLMGRHFKQVRGTLDAGLTIFNFHDVSDTPAPFVDEQGCNVTTALFRKQVDFISSNFNVVPAEACLAGDLPARPALITFDDGYAGTFNNALPILREDRLPSVVLVNMSPILGGNFWAERTTYLCRKVESFQKFLIAEGLASEANVHQAHVECTQGLVDRYESEYGADYLAELDSYNQPYATTGNLEEADEDPNVTLGSHLYTHYNVRTLSDEMLLDQHRKNNAALAGYRRFKPLFAFPFGQPGSCFTQRQADLLLQNGADLLLTAWPSPNADSSSRILDRISLTPEHNTDRKLWAQVVKYPVLKMLGRAREPWAQSD
ncbi:MAG: polysaccharide deacetylase family protein [Chloroflexi bacterium]|nr:polysaccharide deacetylase family protein [Chloroflexota bacterium]